MQTHGEIDTKSPLKLAFFANRAAVALTNDLPSQRWRRPLSTRWRRRVTSSYDPGCADEVVDGAVACDAMDGVKLRGPVRGAEYCHKICMVL